MMYCLHDGNSVQGFPIRCSSRRNSSPAKLATPGKAEAGMKLSVRSILRRDSQRSRPSMREMLLIPRFRYSRSCGEEKSQAR